MSETIKTPAHMRWAYLIAESPKTHCEIAQRYAFDALNTLRLPVPAKLAACFQTESAE
jgi:hypothetical protein